MTSTKPARGMRDFLPADVRRRAHVIGIVTEVYQRYGFEPLETPAVENLETLMGKYGEEGNQLVFRIQKRGDALEISDESLRTVISAISFTLRLAEGPENTRTVLSEDGARGRINQETVKKALRQYQDESVDLALRYDLTVPLARVVAEYRAVLPKFFKRYQIQPVWRADRPARGRFREFYQCDVDVLGSKAVIVEAELCAAVSEVLTRLGFQDFVIRMNHRQLLSAMLGAAGVPAEKSGDALVALDKLDKIGRGGVEQEFATRGIDTASAVKLLDLFETLAAAEPAKPDNAATAAAQAGVGTGPGTAPAAVGSTPVPAATAAVAAPAGDAAPDRDAQNARVLATLADFMGDTEGAAAALEDLRTIVRYAASTPARGRIALDASLARGLSYYTGAIMEIAVPDLAGSLGGGGRYDNLVGMFLGPNQTVPACGFSLGLERIIVIMTERKMFPDGLDAAPADVMVTLWNADRVPDALALAAELRAAGLRVDVYPDADKIGKQFKYASTRGIPKVAILGDDEVARGEVAIKDLVKGEQHTVPRAEAAAAIRPPA